MNYILRSAQASGFSQTLSCKTPTNLTVDGCSAQTEASECLNGTRTLLLFSLVMLFTAKRNLSQGNPIQGLSLNHQSISGLEPERPVTVCAMIRNSCMLAPCLSYCCLFFFFFCQNTRSLVWLQNLQRRKSHVCYPF